MTNEPEPLDKLGMLVMKGLRDRCLHHFDQLAGGQWRAPALQRLQRDLGSLSEEHRAVARRCLVASVDSAIHDFLFRLQESAETGAEVKLLVDGQDVVALSDGIHGEPFGPDGWQARFSDYGEAPSEA